MSKTVKLELTEAEAKALLAGVGNSLASADATDPAPFADRKQYEAAGRAREKLMLATYR